MTQRFKYRIFRQTRVRFTQKGKIGRLHLFLALKNRFLKKQENGRKNEKNAGNPAFFGVHLFCMHYVSIDYKKDIFRFL